jgi:phage terminase small subunit
MRKTQDAEWAFIQRYIVDFNATRAVLECGAYDCKTYMAAAVHGSRLLSRPRVQTMLQDALNNRARRWTVTGERVLRELARSGFSNMLDYITINPDGSAYVDLKLLQELRENDPDAAYDLGAAIQEMTSETYMEGHGEDAVPVKRVKLKLHNKHAALELLGKHCGLFKADDGDKLPPNVTFNVVYVQDAEREKRLQAERLGEGSNGHR